MDIKRKIQNWPNWWDLKFKIELKIKLFFVISDNFWHSDFCWVNFNSIYWATKITVHRKRFFLLFLQFLTNKQIDKCYLLEKQDEIPHFLSTFVATFLRQNQPRKSGNYPEMATTLLASFRRSFLSNQFWNLHQSNGVERWKWKRYWPKPYSWISANWRREQKFTFEY